MKRLFCIFFLLFFPLLCSAKVKNPTLSDEINLITGAYEEYAIDLVPAHHTTFHFMRSFKNNSWHFGLPNLFTYKKENIHSLHLNQEEIMVFQYDSKKVLQKFSLPQLSFSVTNDYCSAEIREEHGATIPIRYVFVPHRPDLLQEVWIGDHLILKYEYTPSGFIHKRIDRNGDFIINHYDQQGRVIAQEAPKGIHGEVITIKKFFYYPEGTEVEDGLGYKTFYRIDPLSKKIISIKSPLKEEFFLWQGDLLTDYSVRDPDGTLLLRETYVFDSCENLIQKTSGDEEDSFTIFYEYDAHGRLIEKREGSSLTQYEYGKGHTLAKTFFNDHLVSRVITMYDAQGFPVEIISDDDDEHPTERHITRKTYYKEGLLQGLLQKEEEFFLDLTTQKEKLLKSITCSYNLMGLITKEEISSEEKIIYTKDYTYDPCGKLIEIRDSLGNIQKFDTNKITQKKSHDTDMETISYTLTPQGNLLSETIEQKNHLTKSIHNYFDPLGRKISDQDELGNKNTYYFDGLGRMIKRIFPWTQDETGKWVRPSELYRYNALGWMIYKKDALGQETFISYHFSGKPKTILYPDGSQELFSYFPNGSLKSYTSRSGEVFSYTRDFLQRPIEITVHNKQGVFLYRETFSFNPFRMLSHEKRDRYENVEKEIYSFFGYPKPLQKESQSSIEKYTYDSSFLLTSIEKEEANAFIERSPEGTIQSLRLQKMSLPPKETSLSLPPSFSVMILKED